MENKKLNIVIYSIILLSVIVLLIPLIVKFLGTPIGNLLYIAVSVSIAIILFSLLKL